MSPPPPPPSTIDSFGVVSVASLEAALKKLNVDVVFQDLLDAIHAEDELRANSTVELEVAERRAALTQLALHTPTGLEMTTVSEFIANPPEPTNVDPLLKERRRRLLELTKEAFPDGVVSDPFTSSTWLSISQETSANKLPFIRATRIVVTNAEDPSPNPPQSVFTNVWVLWDTGAQTSFVLTSQLSPAVTRGQSEGSCFMDITFSDVKTTINSVIHFRPQLPNGVTFIILGQHALLNRLQYQIQTVAVNPVLAQQFPQAYGLISLETWADPGTNKNVPL